MDGPNLNNVPPRKCPPPSQSGSNPFSPRQIRENPTPVGATPWLEIYVKQHQKSESFPNAWGRRIAEAVPNPKRDSPCFSCMASVMILLLYMGVGQNHLSSPTKKQDWKRRKNSQKGRVPTTVLQTPSLKTASVCFNFCHWKVGHFNTTNTSVANVNPNGDTTHPERTLQGWKQSWEFYVNLCETFLGSTRKQTLQR